MGSNLTRYTPHDSVRELLPGRCLCCGGTGAHPLTRLEMLALVAGVDASDLRERLREGALA